MKTTAKEMFLNLGRGRTSSRFPYWSVGLVSPIVRHEATHAVARRKLSQHQLLWLSYQAMVVK
jgi:hypothetical protein